MGVSHSVAPLKEANAKYQELVDVRAENQINTNTINVKKVRKETDTLYKELARFVFANHIVNPSAETANFSTLFNKLIDDTISANKQRLAQALINKKSAKLYESKSASE